MYKKIKHNNDLDTIIIYKENVLDDPDLKKLELYKYLDDMNDFEGAEKYSHRLQKWYQQDGQYFSKKWKNKSYNRWISKEYDEIMLKIQKKIGDITIDILKKYGYSYHNFYLNDNFYFNSCLVNKYRDGNDIIKPHRDAIESFGEYPIISNLSIGSDRKIKFEHNKNMFNIDNNDFEINLKSGSLLIMAGSSQKYFRHSIPPVIEQDSIKTRYSMTFRHYIV